MTRRVASLALLGLLAGCAGGAIAQPQAALPAPTGNALDDAVALLAAAESAPGPQARALLVARLDALDVRLAEGAGDDPLGQWRAEHEVAGGIPWRGRALGPAYRRARVGAGESLRIEQVFLAGQRAEIAAQASGGGQVALAIANPRSEAVCEKELAPRANCNWLPIFTERFSIELKNSGSQPASVYIVFR